MSDRKLPDPLSHSREVETGLLSCMIHDPAILADAVLNIPPDTFYGPAERLLYEVFTEFHLDERPLDCITLYDHLERHDLMERVGGRDVPFKVVDFVPTPAHYRLYKAELFEHKLKRDLTLLAQDIQLGIKRHPDDLKPLIELTVSRLKSLSEVADLSGKSSVRHSALLAGLDACRIDLSNPPPKPVAVYSLDGQQICTPCNLTVISAQAKGGKSAVVSAMVAASLVGVEPGPDCLGFTASAPQGKAVIVFDTEQAPFDAWRLLKRAADRVELEALPPHLRHYRLFDQPTARRRRMLAVEMERAHAACGGIHSVIVDGIADLCRDPNDPEEAFGLIDELIQLASRFQCPIIVILHENPASARSGFDTGKTRGHLGSQLERKAESNLRIVKDADEVSSLYSERCRSASLPKGRAIRFAWCDREQMHMRVTQTAAERAKATKLEEQQPVAEAVFRGTTGPVLWGDLLRLLAEVAGAKGKTGERRIKLWNDLGLVKKAADGYLLA